MQHLDTSNVCIFKNVFLNYTNDKRFLPSIVFPQCRNSDSDISRTMEKILYGFHISELIFFLLVYVFKCEVKHNKISNDITAITFMHLDLLNIQTLRKHSSHYNDIHYLN
jgi:hypothetical protein